jgi:hypothetical protein
VVVDRTQEAVLRLLDLEVGAFLGTSEPTVDQEGRDPDKPPTTRGFTDSDGAVVALTWSGTRKLAVSREVRQALTDMANLLQYAATSGGSRSRPHAWEPGPPPCAT